MLKPPALVDLPSGPPVPGTDDPAPVSVYVDQLRLGVLALQRRTLTPEQFGAVGDGVTDDQAALVAMWAAVRPGDYVRMAGRYAHSGILVGITVPAYADRVVVDGTGGELYATNRAAAAMRWVGLSGITVVGLRHRVVAYNGSDNGGNGRLSNDDLTTPFYVVSCTHVEFVDCYSENSAQAGFYVNKTRRSRFIRPTVQRSYADGFHMTHNCEDLTVVDPVVHHPGDDGVAVVSYFEDGGVAIGPCRRIKVWRPKVRYCHARGVSIVGGEDVTYYDVDVQWTRAAGGYIACENGTYTTHAPVRCRVKGGSMRHIGYAVVYGNGNLDAALDHGPLFMLSQNVDRPVVDCGFDDVEVADLGAPAFQYQRAVSNNGGLFQNCTWNRTVISPGGRDGTSVTSATAGTTAVDTVDNRQAPQMRRVAADVTNSAVATVNSGIGWSQLLPGTYAFEVYGHYSAAATTTGIRFNWGFSGAQSAFDCMYDVATSATAVQRGVTQATNTEFVGAASAGATMIPFAVTGSIVVTAIAVLDFKVGSEIAGSAVVLERGTWGRLTKVA